MKKARAVVTPRKRRGRGQEEAHLPHQVTRKGSETRRNGTSVDRGAQTKTIFEKRRVRTGIINCKGEKRVDRGRI